MLGSIVSAALLGVSAVSAAPAHSGQVPFKFPLRNGFPNIEVPSKQLMAIEKQAQGTLPNTPLLESLSDTDITNFQVVAFNEIFEVAFFSSLIHNITHEYPGYTFDDPEEKEYVLKSFRTIRAQEELHAIGANAILKTAGATPIEPCEYVFPSNSYETAVDFARTFTDIVLGALQGVQFALATTGEDDAAYVPLVGSIIGQEGEQVGYYRSALDLVPSALPFLTRTPGAYAYSALNQMVIAPGSCPNANIIQVPILPALTVNTSPIKPMNQQLEFSFMNQGHDCQTISFVYLNQQNKPIVVRPTVVSQNGNEVTISAPFPYQENLLNGLTLAAVTSSAGPFEDGDAVAADTLYGPGIIEIN